MSKANPSSVEEQLEATAAGKRIDRKYTLSIEAVQRLEGKARKLGLSYSRTLECIILGTLGRAPLKPQEPVQKVAQTIAIEDARERPQVDFEAGAWEE